MPWYYKRNQARKLQKLTYKQTLLSTLKLYVGALSDLCEMYKLFIHTIQSKVSVSVTKWLFLFTQEHFIQVGAFESSIPLSCFVIK